MRRYKNIFEMFGNPVQNQIILDQNWAMKAIYALFDRKKIQPLLRGYGRFSRTDLEALIWSGYTVEEQKVFLGMMESCAALSCENFPMMNGNISLQTFCPNGPMRRNSF